MIAQSSRMAELPPPVSRRHTEGLPEHPHRACAESALHRSRRFEFGLEPFYATVKLASSGVNVLHAVVHRALKTAVHDRLIVANRNYMTADVCPTCSGTRREAQRAVVDGLRHSAATLLLSAGVPSKLSAGVCLLTNC